MAWPRIFRGALETVPPVGLWMRRTVRWVVLGLALATGTAITSCVRPAQQPRPRLILISLDGFRWDYPDRPPAATLQALAARGVRAEGLIPIFPSKTFPNHYSMVTGLTAEHHGLIANNIFDPGDSSRYSLGNREAVGDSKWYGGEPIWVTAEKAGLRTAPIFWPGSEAAIEGVRPTSWRSFDFADRPDALVRELLERLDAPPDSSPSFMTLYFHETDDMGHRHGTDSPELDGAIATVDSALALLLAGLEERGLKDSIDIMVVSDHGMADTSNDRVILLDRVIDLDRVMVSDWNPVVAIWPRDVSPDTVYRQLERQAHLTAYRKADIPDRLHYRNNPRIAPIIAVADVGWSITTSDYLTEHPNAFAGATHGYDPAARSMQGIFIAAGPSFRNGITVPPTATINLYDVMCAVLGLDPAPNDGDVSLARRVLSPAVVNRSVR